METNGTILKILKEYYTDNVAYLKISNEFSDPIEVKKDLRQGCSLFQFYLIFVWDKTLDHWKKSSQGMGVPVEENKCLFSLNCCDDQVIIAQDADHLECILRRLNRAYKEWYLTFARSCVVNLREKFSPGPGFESGSSALQLVLILALQNVRI